MRESIKVRGIQLVYEDHGAGEVLVFIHGQPFNRSMWQQQVAAFKAHHRLIIPDLRGYGESEVPEKITLLDELALDIIHLLAALDIQKAVFIGLSMGGQILFELYRLAPQLFRAMVLADTAAAGETAQSYVQRLQLSRDLLEKGMAAYTSEKLPQFLAKDTLAQQPTVVQHLRNMMETTPALGASVVQRGRAERRDHTEMLPTIDCPVLIIVGEEDEFTPVRVAEGMQQQIRNAELVVIKAASHMPNMEQPDAFNKALAAFLK